MMPAGFKVFQPPARFVVAAMEPDDIARVRAIDRASFANPWDEKLFIGAIRADFAEAWVVRDARAGARSVVGFLTAARRERTLRLYSLAVAESFRGQGLARLLLDRLRRRCLELGLNRIALEVRHANRSALGLYRSIGFVQTGLKRAYYPDTGEDAVLMAWEIGPEIEDELTTSA